MESPTDVSLPFLAYGIFRPGQLAFFQIADLVDEVNGHVEIPGRLLVRDGLPIVELTSLRGVATEGDLISFRPGTQGTAYARIVAMEPDRQYRWGAVPLGECTANILVARQSTRGSESWDYEGQWDGWEDPVFTAALAVIEETLADSGRFAWDMRPTFRLQMAYLLLWSSIERYLSLRYHFGRKSDASRFTISDLLKKLYEEPAFAEALVRRVTRTDRIYRADDPGKHVDLKPADPKKSCDYYYQVRSNITHRGKGMVRDHEIVAQSVRELLSIFRDVLVEAKAHSQRLAASF